MGRTFRFWATAPLRSGLYFPALNNLQSDSLTGVHLMRRYLLLLCTLAFALSSSALVAQDGNDDEGGLHRRSIDRKPFDADPESYPGGPLGKAPLSTGYYVT